MVEKNLFIHTHQAHEREKRDVIKIQNFQSFLLFPSLSFTYLLIHVSLCEQCICILYMTVISTTSFELT